MQQGLLYQKNLSMFSQYIENDQTTFNKKTNGKRIKVGGC